MIRPTDWTQHAVFMRCGISDLNKPYIEEM